MPSNVLVTCLISCSVTFRTRWRWNRENSRSYLCSSHFFNEIWKVLDQISYKQICIWIISPASSVLAPWFKTHLITVTMTDACVCCHYQISCFVLSIPNHFIWISKKSGRVIIQLSGDKMCFWKQITLKPRSYVRYCRMFVRIWTQLFDWKLHPLSETDSTV